MPCVLSKCCSFAALAGSLYVLGCRGNEITLPSRSWTAKVHGTVLGPQGGRVPSATVTIQAVEISRGGPPTKLGACTGQLLSPRTLVADAHGDFTFDWNGTVIPDFVCLSIDAIGTAAGRSLVGHIEADSILLHYDVDVPIVIRLRPAQ